MRIETFRICCQHNRRPDTWNKATDDLISRVIACKDRLILIILFIRIHICIVSLRTCAAVTVCSLMMICLFAAAKTRPVSCLCSNCTCLAIERLSIDRLMAICTLILHRVGYVTTNIYSYPRYLLCLTPFGTTSLPLHSDARLMTRYKYFRETVLQQPSMLL